MPERRRVFLVLVRYFFTRFFENDLAEAEGDTTTSVVRALSIVAAPSLLVAFFIHNQYAQSAPWAKVSDHVFFVVYSFVAMAGVAVFEWEMLFPDKLDFLVLSHLPLSKRQLLGAKAAALTLFFVLFVFAANVFGWGILTIVSREGVGLELWSHAAGVFSAGLCGALLVLAMGGVLICILPGRVFRVVSPLLRMLVVAALGLLLIHYGRFGDQMNVILGVPRAGVRWVPSFWFLGVYECALRGASAPAFAHPMMHRGLLVLAAAFVITMITYPLAWVRVRKMTLEGAEGPRRGATRRGNWLPQRLVPALPSRAVVLFITQTMARNPQYQLYLSMYGGTGLALAISCAITFISHRGSFDAAISAEGLHAIVPLMVFWVVAGLRMAFALPLNLPARWIFRLTGAPRYVCIGAGRVWAIGCGIAVLLVLLLALGVAGLGVRALLVQAVCGLCLCWLLVEGLMFADRGIPFAQPRTPGRTSLPLLLTLFVGVLPIFCFLMVRAELWLEGHLLFLLPTTVLVIGVCATARWLREHIRPALEDGDEIEPEFQLLGLTAE